VVNKEARSSSIFVGGNDGEVASFFLRARFGYIVANANVAVTIFRHASFGDSYAASGVIAISTQTEIIRRRASDRSELATGHAIAPGDHLASVRRSARDVCVLARLGQIGEIGIASVYCACVVVVTDVRRDNVGAVVWSRPKAGIHSAWVVVVAIRGRIDASKRVVADYRSAHVRRCSAATSNGTDGARGDSFCSDASAMGAGVGGRAIKGGQHALHLRATRIGVARVAPRASTAAARQAEARRVHFLRRAFSR